MLVNLSPLVRKGWIVDQLAHIAGYRCFSHCGIPALYWARLALGYKMLGLLQYEAGKCTGPFFSSRHDNGKWSSHDANRRNGTPFLRVVFYLKPFWTIFPVNSL